MKRTIKVVENVRKYDEEIMKKIESNTIELPIEDIVMTPETFTKIFSPERIRLLRRIHQGGLDSIYQLAKELDKPYEVVFRNLKYLEGMQLIRMVTKNNKKSPRIACEFSVDFYGEV